ncbi:MAG: rhombosortase [Proteobacteria bacterium]|nr:rhombosortase [Pseudomonadota bacterium]
MRALSESLNCDGGRGLVLLALVALVLLPCLGGEPARLTLRYDRAGLEAHQWWRLATAHLVHLGVRHALVNALGLVLLWVLFARDYGARQWLAIVAASALAIDAGLWFLSSTVTWYVGSSGVLHGILGAGTLAQLRRREATGYLLAVILIGKLLYEQRIGPLPFSGSPDVVVDAHLYGLAGGVAAALAVGARRQPL